MHLMKALDELLGAPMNAPFMQPNVLKEIEHLSLVLNAVSA